MAALGPAGEVWRCRCWGPAGEGPRSPEAAPLPQHTPLGAPGLYIQTLLPGSPAAADGRLALGDRILEVNGSSLAGVSYVNQLYLNKIKLIIQEKKTTL